MSVINLDTEIIYVNAVLKKLLSIKIFKHDYLESRFMVLRRFFRGTDDMACVSHAQLRRCLFVFCEKWVVVVERTEYAKEKYTQKIFEIGGKFAANKWV